MDDNLAIRRLIDLYALGVDCLRFDLFDEIFTDDVQVDYNKTARWPDLASFKRDFAIFHEPFDATQHMMANCVADIHEDVARVITYGHFRLMRSGVPGGEFWEGQGWYEDEAIRTSSGWRIRSRVHRTLWWAGNQNVLEANPDVRFDLPVESLSRAAAAGELAYFRGRSVG